MQKKSTIRWGLAAFMAAGLLSNPAMADCPGGAGNYSVGVFSFPFSTTGISSAIDTPTAEAFTGESYADYDADCHTPVGIGLGESTTGEIVDGAAPGTGFYSHAPSLTVGPNNSAFGNGATVYTTEQYDTGIADDPLTDEDESTATRIIPVSNGTAIGANSHVGHDHSTAIGADAETDRDNQVVLGTEDDDVTVKSLPGKIDQNTNTVVVHQADGTLASDGGQIYSDLAEHNSRLNAHNALLSQHAATLNEHAAGIAMAMAMPDTWLAEGKSFGIFGGVGGFEDETALGFTAIGRLDPNWTINAGVAADTDFDHVGWKAGFGAQW